MPRGKALDGAAVPPYGARDRPGPRLAPYASAAAGWGQSMRRALLAAAAALALAAPSASADFSPTRAYEGGCTYTYETVTFETYLGEPDPPVIAIDAEAVVYSDTNPGDNPVSATLRCQIWQRGDLVVEAAFTGTTAIAGARVFPKPADFDPGYVSFCETVEYDNGEAEPWRCFHIDYVQPVGAVCRFVDERGGPWLCPPAGA